MKLLILNTYDYKGGAAIATFRLHQGLRSIGVDSSMMVQGKCTDEQTVIGPGAKWKKAIASLRPYLDKLPCRFYRHRENKLFSTALTPDHLASQVEMMNPDIVHLFWVNFGFMKLDTLREFKSPIVWTLHDMWPFTGGCHYDDECGKFRESCGDCPILHSNSDNDLSRRIWLRKRKFWGDVPIVVIATSQWMAEMARASSLFGNQRIEVIPNGIDTAKYKPINKKESRAIFNLPQDKKLVLFSAFNALSDKRKGNQFLSPALKLLSERGWKDKMELVILGASASEIADEIGLKVHCIGNLQDEISQVLLYSAVDVMVAPSMQENLSNTVMESLACGTPVAAFDIGGMPDMIDHQHNGYLAQPFETKDLAAGIEWVLEDSERHSKLSQRARQIVLERYDVQLVAHRYLSLYQSMLNQ